MEFKELKIIEPILKALEKEGYVKPTPIQEKTIPLLLDNKDVIGIAQTGTGKTAAFVVPILQKLHEKKNKATNPKALVLAPTRELAMQISESFKTYGQFLSLKHTVIYGGVGLVPQIRELQHGTDILIATPGRLLDLMNQRKVSLKQIEFLVLDEADRMLDMGFLRDIKKIVSELPREKQSLFFSATMPNEITELTRRFLKNPVRMEITPQSTPVEKIEQCVFFIDMENKIELLLDLIGQQKMNCVLVFVKTKHKADKVARTLSQNRIRADSIHGNKSQAQRTQALNDFKSGKIRVLVATDIAARGIDVENISHVINYDLPNEPENYIHRIGRTARAGTEGIAYSFCSAEERDFLHQIERITKTKTKHADHKYHSIRAKNAVGKDAKPKPRGRSSDRGGSVGRGFKGGNRSGGFKGGDKRGGRDSRNDNKSFKSSKGGRYKSKDSGSFDRKDSKSFKNKSSRFGSKNSNKPTSTGASRRINPSGRRPSSNGTGSSKTRFGKRR